MQLDNLSVQTWAYTWIIYLANKRESGVVPRKLIKPSEIVVKYSYLSQ